MTKEISQLDQTLIEVINKSSNAAGEVFDATKSATEKTIDFAVAQAPDLIHQLLMFKLANAIMIFILSIVSMYLISVATKKFHETTDGAILIFTFIGGVLSSIAFISSLHDILFITIAPKIYLIEYVSKILK